MANSLAWPSIPSTLLATLIVAAVTLGAYFNSLDVPFTFDDMQHIRENPLVHVESFSFSELRDAAIDSPGNRPLASLSFALNHVVGGLDVFGYHVVNIAIHACNGVLVYLLALIVSGRLRTNVDSAALHRLFGLAVALWFVSHPVQTQSVTYVVQRMTSLSTMFYLGALLCYLAGRSNVAWSRRGVWWTGCLSLWVLALLSKEFAVTLPAAILLCEWFLFQDARRSWLKTGLTYGIPAALAIIGIAFLFKGDKVLYVLTDGYARHRDFTLVERVLTQARVVFHYLMLIVLPLPQRLVLIYDIPISSSLVSPVSTLLSVGGVLVLIAGSIAFAHRYKLIAFGILWYFLHLAVESSVLPLEMVYEHRVYMPIIGPLLVIGAGLFAVIRNGRTAVACAGVLAVLLAIGTHVRNRAYEGEYTLWSDNVAKSPTEPRSHVNLALAQYTRGEFEDAYESASRALEFQPKFHRAYVIRAMILVRQAKLQEALADLDTAMAIPAEEIRFAPDYGQTFELRGGVLVDLGKFDRALEDLNRAIAGRPDLPGPYYHRARVYAIQGRHLAAKKNFEKSLELAPTLVDAHNNLAWLLATCPDQTIQDGAAAVKHAEFVNEHFQSTNPSALDTLAAAHARAGNFAEAVSWQERAIELKDPAQAGGYRDRLALYKRGEAYTSRRP